MKMKVFIIAISAIALRCGTQRSEEREQIAGAYVTEISFEASDIHSTEKLGHAKVRDTIYVTVKNDGYEISNKKWRSNSYDLEGWKYLRPGAPDGAMSTYYAKFDPTANSLISEPRGMFSTLYLDTKAGSIRRNKTTGRVYSKID